MEQTLEREQAIRRWFSMWLTGADTGISTLFARDCVYIESWGPAYQGSAAVARWFEEWNRRGQVLRWEIRQFFHRDDQTVVEWLFACRTEDLGETCFEGLSLVRFDGEGRIAALQEFGCRLPHYDPYSGGPAPRDQEG